MELPPKCARADDALSTGAEERERSDNSEEDEGGKHKNAHGLILSSDIGPDDILSTGRPLHTSRHVGNARFVDTVMDKISLYEGMPSSNIGDRWGLCEEIVCAVKGRGGRFLRLISGGGYGK